MKSKCSHAAIVVLSLLVLGTQPALGKKFIPSDTSIGTWDFGTSTYTLTTDVTETIQINGHSFTLDGAGHTVTGPRSGPGIYLDRKRNVTIQNVNVQGSYYGIFLYYSDHCTLTGNTLSGNRYGIRLRHASNNVLKDNTSSDNESGIYVDQCRQIALTGNTVSNNLNGISLYYCRDDILTGNTSSDNSLYGISLYYCSNNILSGNRVSGSRYNFYVSGTSDTDYDHNIDTSNTVDGKPIYYLNDVTGEVYDSSTTAGVFYAINCNGITIKDLTLVNNFLGVFLWNTQNSIIENVFASNNYIGINLYHSSDNILTANMVSNNRAGILLWTSDDNQIYNNNFISNPTQASASGSGNVFNLPTGGNYWSNWTAPDADADGFVDSPHVFPGGQDDFPWAFQDGWLNHPPVADAGLDQTVYVGDQAMLDGSASTDPDGDSLTYIWSFVSVPTGSQAEIEDPTAVKTSFAADIPGEYVVDLIVNDGKIDSDPDTVMITALSLEQAIEQVGEALYDIVDSHPGTPLADKIEDALYKLLTALEEFDKSDNQAAVGNIEGAVGDLEAAVKDGLLDAEQGTQLLDDLAGIARELAENALGQAIAQGGDPDDIADAELSLVAGDEFWAVGAYKDAVNKYKDALAKAESTL